ncbi:GTPase SAR1 family protein [Lentzea waywayandensis]|uniref:GTPase SAR1 family protein n=1 Tax=Lentzea waywayandensis TaxID=84724 RepID=A0A1I6FDW5_9PSEU|nr:hypothetical protein [Lentzea waywayandensis]SFR28098.1 GTPase SAR1 family protein [Lentzea waywayandensis]
MTQPFKVAMVGPTAVGKTTLLSAILDQTQTLLNGTPIEVAAAEETERKLATNRKELAKALAAEEFEVAALRSTQQVTNYDVRLRSIDVPSLSVPFAILDFPGGWLDPDARAGSPQAGAQWARCMDHIQQSMMLVVPIDAAVLMETSTGKERAARVVRLGLPEVVEVVRKWARLRNQVPDEPAILVLAPLKCEKYFSDNGRDTGFTGHELATEVRAVYEDVLNAARDQASLRPIRIVYAPIDTYGCVELMEACWEPGPDGDLKLTTRYRFRGAPPKISIRAASTVTQELCQAIVTARRAEEELDRAGTLRRVDALTGRRDQKKGFFGALRYFVSGEASKVAAGIESGTSRLAVIEQRHRQLAAALEALAAHQQDDRVEIW